MVSQPVGRHYLWALALTQVAPFGPACCLWTQRCPASAAPLPPPCFSAPRGDILEDQAAGSAGGVGPAPRCLSLGAFVWDLQPPGSASASGELGALEAPFLQTQNYRVS